MKRPTLQELEDKANEIGRSLSNVIRASEGYGFALIVFNLGEKGHLTYTSNSKREDMIAALDEMLAHLKTGAVAPLGQPNHAANKRGRA
jgi:hypothetical protein